LVPYKISFAKSTCCLLRSTNVSAMYAQSAAAHSGYCYLVRVFANYPQRSRVYVVRLSCELPYAVGVRKNAAHSITDCQRKQSKKADHIRCSLRVLFLNICAPNLSYSSLPMLPFKALHQSHADSPHWTIFATSY
jgi:hypothetical protein